MRLSLMLKGNILHHLEDQQYISPRPLGICEGRPTRRVFLSWVIAACTVAALPDQALADIPSPVQPLPDRSILMLVAIAQPVSAKGLVRIATEAFGELDQGTEATFETVLRRLADEGLVVQVRPGPPSLFSVTALGQTTLPVEDRLLRDRARLFLMRGDLPLQFSRVRDAWAVGDSPTHSFRFRTQPPTCTIIWCWADEKSGNRPRAREKLPRYLSFDTIEQIQIPCPASERSHRLSYAAIVLCLGLSPSLLEWFIDNPGRCYRVFCIPKARGGVRRLVSPRTFLKSTQRALLHCFLDDLKVHDAVHSFRRGRSHVSNALAHERRRFVGGTDIENFFGSITSDMVADCLMANGFDSECSMKLARLCTRKGELPQGAPTSPALSNALLYPFDEAMAALCAKSDLRYTRYADDVTISGDNRSAVIAALDQAEVELRNRYGFRINRTKRHVAGRDRQQRVTGAVVNTAAAPERAVRRRVRAIFHQASTDPRAYADQIQRLGGYISYLQAFPSLRGSSALARYQMVFAKHLRMFPQS